MLKDGEEEFTSGLIHLSRVLLLQNDTILWKTLDIIPAKAANTYSSIFKIKQIFHKRNDSFAKLASQTQKRALSKLIYFFLAVPLLFDNKTTNYCVLLIPNLALKNISFW